MSVRLHYDRQFILARVMQMIEILDNQSGAARQLLKTRLAHRVYCVIEPTRRPRSYDHATALRFILF